MDDQQAQFKQLRAIARRIERGDMAPFRVSLFWLLGYLSCFGLICLAYPYLPGSVSSFSLTGLFLCAFNVGAKLFEMTMNGRCTWEGMFMFALARYTPTKETAYRELSHALIHEGVDMTRVMIWLEGEHDRLSKMRAVESPHRKSELPAVKRLRERVGLA